MMREHELSCNTHSNKCDRLRVCQEKLYLAKLLLLWPYTTKLNNLSYYIPRSQGGRLQSKTARRIWRMSEKILHLGGCIWNTLRWAMNHEWVPRIMRDKVPWCSGPVLFPDPHQVAGFIHFKDKCVWIVLTSWASILSWEASSCNQQQLITVRNVEVHFLDVYLISEG